MSRFSRLAPFAIAAGALAVAPSALGAGVTLTPPSPANGASIQTDQNGVSLPLGASLSAAGCHPDSVAGIFPRVKTETNDGSRPLLIESTPTKGRMYRTTPVTRSTSVRWWIEFSCRANTPTYERLEVRSEVRTLTLLAPDKRPRATGPYRVSLSAKIKEPGKRARSTSGAVRATFTPRCATGPCTATVAFAGIGRTKMVYNPRKRVWTGRITGSKVGKMWQCTRIGRSTTKIRNAYRGNLTIKLRSKTGPGNVRVVGSGTESRRMVGTITGKIIPNAKGKRNGCRTGQVRGSLRATQLS